MLCGISLFESNITESHSDWLIRNFSFSGSFVVRDGLEISSPSRRNTNRNGDEQDCVPFVWRKLIYSHIEVRLGWNTNPLNGTAIYRLKLIGSIHKFARNGDNSGFFSANDAVVALRELCLIFRVEPSRLKITNLEIGVNVPVDFCVKSFLLLNLVRYKNKAFSANSSQGGNGYIAEYTHYGVKLYEKAANILRFEIHWGDLQELRDQYNLFYASDLNAGLINKIAGDKLLERLANTVLLDGVDIITEVNKRSDGMNAKELTILTRYSSNTYLNQLHEYKNRALSKREKDYIYQKDGRLRSKFIKLNLKYGNGTVKHLTSQIFEILNRSTALSGTEKNCQKVEAGIKFIKLTVSDNRQEGRGLKKGINNNYKINNTMKNSNDNTQVESVEGKVTFHKSKRQVARERDEKSRKVIQSFMTKLGETLKAIAA